MDSLQAAALAAPGAHDIHGIQPPPAHPPTHNPKIRKRTKTGCLTCRKRRIKCGEERPTCRNCAKSKRHCEGYAQRVTFRAPVANWPNGQGGIETTLQYHNSSLPGAGRAERQPPPAPLDLGGAGFIPEPQYTPTHPSSGLAVSWTYDMSGRLVPMPLTPMTPMVPPSAGPFTTTAPGGTPFYAQPPSMQWQTDSSSHVAATTEALQSSDFASSQFAIPMAPQMPSSAGPGPQDYAQFMTTTTTEPTMPASSLTLDPGEMDWQMRAVHEQSLRWFDTNDESAGKTVKDTQRGYSNDSQPEDIPRPQTLFTAKMLSSGAIPSVQYVSSTDDLLRGAAVEKQDDDYYDVESDDDFDLERTQRDLGLMSIIHQQSSSDIAMRRYDAFIYDGVLDRYQAEFQASPLKNELTARVFTHFITATGPSLGIFERNQRNASAMFNHNPVPMAQQSLWTYSLPLMALSNQGLLHAMLALSSLHIANLQGASTTPSVKHYGFALKRVHKAVGSDKKRHHVTTLAATLLLGYYEVMTADHAKWCSHLTGAKQLLSEIDFPTITKEAIRLEKEESLAQQGNEFSFSTPEEQFQSAIDEHLISNVVGRQLRYDEFGRVVAEIHRSSNAEEQVTTLLNTGKSSGKVPTQMDLQTYKLYQDLWWWFARQDAYQSIVSGNRLLMDYARWSDCPPRARIGRDDATYGTHDHIMLLLGRIAEFSAKDRKRKLSGVKASGGQWRPPSGGEFKGLGRMGPPPGMPQQGPGAPTG